MKNNSQAARIQTEFFLRSIPFSPSYGIKIFSSVEIKDIFAYFEFLKMMVLRVLLNISRNMIRGRFTLTANILFLLCHNE
jgi:superfamily I DNA/RNA helicase